MEKKDFYEGEYMPQMHKIGKLTGLLGAVLSFLPALVLAVVYGLLPKPAALATAFISAASAFGFSLGCRTNFLLYRTWSGRYIHGIFVRKYFQYASSLCRYGSGRS